MIGRIRKVRSRHKENLIIFRIPHRTSRSPSFSFVKAGFQYISGLSVIRKDALSVPPSVRSKKQCHRKIFLPVRRRTIRVLFPVRGARPSKISLIFPLFHPHICLRPFPQPVEFVLHIELDTQHHTITHSFRSGIVIPRIHNVGHILSHRIVHSFLLFKEKSIFDFLQPSLNLFLRNPHLPKYISITSCFLHTPAPFLYKSCPDNCSNVNVPQKDNTNRLTLSVNRFIVP